MQAVVVLILIAFIYRSRADLPFQKYSCGVNEPTRFISFLMTSNCDQDDINECCNRHDRCYSSCRAPQMICDAEFCECLLTLPGNSFCRDFVQASHCSLVQWFGDRFICPPMRRPPMD